MTVEFGSKDSIDYIVTDSSTLMSLIYIIDSLYDTDDLYELC